jgi:UDP-GlcNAc:undecaprenyl-phosphate/decaprenyl-phosphate GlcNAc-1-phosphate transferase
MQSFWNIVQHYQLFGALALVAAVFLTPVAMRLAHRFGILDIPDQKLKPHAKPIPYLGGTAIAIAWAAALVAAMLTGVCDWHQLLPLLLGGVAMSSLGLLDDICDVSPRLRLAAGALIIAAVILTTGAGREMAASGIGGASDVAAEVGLPFIAQPLKWLLNLALPLSLLLGVFIVLGACNSANLIDGLDGLCSGVTGIISLSFFLLAAHLAAGGWSVTGDPVRLTLAVALFGAVLGFLPWNFNPAKIFMGDAGSMLLGYNCGMLILLFAERGKFRWVLGALMIFALPIFDTALAMFRRWRAGRSIFSGDRSHFYDQLVQRGLSVRQTVFVCYGLTLFYAAIGLLLTWVDKGGPVIRTRHAVFLYLGVVLVTAVVAWRAGLTHAERLPTPPEHAEPAGSPCGRR